MRGTDPVPIDQQTLHYLQQMNNYIRSLNERLDYTENRLQHLEDEIQALKKDNKMQVGTIEYKFDQLKIERLDGTLNIGLTPKSEEDLLDDLSVGQGQNVRADQDPLPNALLTNTNEHIRAYLHTGFMEDIKEIEKKQAFPLTDPYRLFIIEDIRKQLPNRVIQLVQAMNNEPDKREMLESEPEKAEDLLFDTVKKDILTGVEQFILKLKNGGETQ